MAPSRPTLLLTRPEEASRRFLASLDQDLIAEVDVVISPLVRIDYLTKPVDLEAVAGVIFTSAHGVHAAGPVPTDQSHPAYCVGVATTQAATQAGWQAHQMGEDAASLITSLLTHPPAVPLLHIRGEHARGDIAETLTKQGFRCDEVVMYRQIAQSFSETAIATMAGDGPIIAPLFSPRTADLFCQGALDRPFRIAAMSAAIAGQIQKNPHWNVVTTPHPTATEMRLLVEKLLQSHVPG